MGTLNQVLIAHFLKHLSNISFVLDIGEKCKQNLAQEALMKTIIEYLS